MDHLVQYFFPSTVLVKDLQEMIVDYVFPSYIIPDLDLFARNPQFTKQQDDDEGGRVSSLPYLIESNGDISFLYHAGYGGYGITPVHVDLLNALSVGAMYQLTPNEKGKFDRWSFRDLPRNEFFLIATFKRLEELRKPLPLPARASDRQKFVEAHPIYHSCYGTREDQRKLIRIPAKYSNFLAFDEYDGLESPRWQEGTELKRLVKRSQQVDLSDAHQVRSYFQSLQSIIELMESFPSLSELVQG
jgi:hypothetical protein